MLEIMEELNLRWGGPTKFPLGLSRKLTELVIASGQFVLLLLTILGALNFFRLAVTSGLIGQSFLTLGQPQLFVWLGLLAFIFLIYLLAFRKAPRNRVSARSRGYVFDALAPSALHTLQQTVLVAEKLATSLLTPELLLLAALDQTETKIFLLRGGLHLQNVQALLIDRVQKSSGSSLTMSEETERILLKSYQESLARQGDYVELSDLVAAIFSLPRLMAVLEHAGLNEDDIKLLIRWWQREKAYHAPRLPSVWRELLKPKRNLNVAWTAQPTPMLDRFSENLTELARLGFMPKAEVREEEIQRALAILTRNTKNNVILVGQPGVGKSSIVGGIALEMIKPSAPTALQDKKLISLNTSRLVAEAPGFGGVQALLAKVVDEASRAGNVVLYIANTHILATAQAGGIANITGILLPALQSNSFQFIGTSNPEEYRAFIENNEELSNFLEEIEIKELDAKSATLVLTYLAGLIERKQGVIITLAAIKKAVELTVKYIHDRVLPDKAEEVLDEAAALAVQSRQVIVSDDLISKVIETRTKVPVEAAQGAESQKLLNLESQIHQRLINQNEAVGVVSDALRRARAELASDKKPIGNFLFVGPTGVGKTELAKTLAAVYFGGEDSMIRLDMTEFKTSESINRLIGAPLGTTEVEKGGVFTEAVRHKPFSLILLDELEKAAQNVQDVFLQVMDDGRLTDSSGRQIDFTNSILIATSNAGSQFIADSIRSGKDYQTMRQELINQVLQQSFKPEFLNRFDAVVVFKPLTLAEVKEIAKLQIVQLKAKLEAQKIRLVVEDEAVDKLAKLGFDPSFGARPLRRVIQEKVENEIAKEILAGSIKPGDQVIIKGEVI
jgi:ATP-dependent Clp protease ATP-binding subunit ClpC